MKNKTILITGGTTGIGLATAQLLSNEGAKVIITGRNPETLAAAQRALPDNVVVIQSDAGSFSAAQSLGAEIKKHVPHLDGAFLNAGIAQFGPLEAMTSKHYDDMFNVNVLSPGPIATPIIKRLALPAELQQKFEELTVGKSLVKRFGTAEEVAKLARFLLSEDSSYIFGAEMIIDAGVRLA